MKCITDITVIDTQDDLDFFEIEKYKTETGEYPTFGDSKQQTQQINMEMITGKTFTTSAGNKVCIGMAKHVQDLLELPFEVYNNQEKVIQDKIEYIEILKKSLKTLGNKQNQMLHDNIKLGNSIMAKKFFIDHMSLFKRFMFFVTGKLPISLTKP